MLKPKWSTFSPLSITHSPTTRSPRFTPLTALPVSTIFARPFVAGRHRILDRDDVLAAIEFVVGMADADRAHAHENFIRPDMLGVGRSLT